MQLGPRLGPSAAETETVAWLVRHHLAMSSTSFQRDPMDPKTIESFAALVQSPERLRLLVLTVCDIRAVGRTYGTAGRPPCCASSTAPPSACCRAARWVGGRAERIKAIQAEVAERLTGWTDADKEEHFARGYAPYWLSFTPDTLARQAELARRRARLPAARHRASHRHRALRHRGHGSTLDTHGLFARLAGAMAVSGANIVDAKIFTPPTVWRSTRSGCRTRGQAVRRPATPGQARRAGRAGAQQSGRHPARARQPAQLHGRAAIACSRSSRAC